MNGYRLIVNKLTVYQLTHLHVTKLEKSPCISAACTQRMKMYIRIPWIHM